MKKNVKKGNRVVPLHPSIDPSEVEEQWSDHEAISNHFTEVGGALGELIRIGHKMSHMDTSFPSLAGALVGLSAAANNMWHVEWANGRKTHLNLYVLLIMPSGAGKEAGRSVARQCAQEAQAGFYDSMTSDAALHNALCRNKNVLLSIDEFGRVLSNARKTTGSHQKSLVTALMSAWGLADKVLASRGYADGKNDKPEVYNPYVSLFGVSTLVRFVEGVEAEDTEDGTLNRLLVIPGGDPQQKPYDAPTYSESQLPEHLRNMLANMAAGRIANNQMKGNRPVTPKPQLPKKGVIEPDMQADDLLRAYHEDVDKRKRAAGDMRGLWGRALEIMVRLAGLLALADEALKGPIYGAVTMQATHVNYAYELVCACTNWVEREIGEVVRANTEKDKIRVCVLRALHELPARIKHPRRPGPEFVPLSKITERIKSKTKQRSLITDTLEEMKIMNEIRESVVSAEGRGRPTSFFALSMPFEDYEI
ncbi:DUF3987 domain-containing protein [Primorskyibacter sp. S87]|uniref:DUF3987 domain-containing protein n=1 Tax=Primorskyibacter sp. S87 TaxID=3415126 RepID=UPI003C7B9313